MEFNFTLKYRLPDTGNEIGVLEQRLAEGGCDDALVGLGLPGRLALAFCREADSAGAALRSALDDVQRAVPGAELVEVSPDLVGLTDVADLLGMSRQNMRKLMLANPQSFPSPCMTARPRSGIWSTFSVGCERAAAGKSRRK